MDVIRKVVQQQIEGKVETFIGLPSDSAVHDWLQQWRNYWNRSIFASYPNKNSSVAEGPGNGETNSSCLFARCCCDAARKARRYSARCNSTAVAAAADGAAIT